MIAWTDVEASGLDERVEHLLEVALVVTDDELNEVSHWSTVVRPVGVDLEEMIAKCDPVVREMHTKNGLFAELRAGCGMRRHEAETMFIEFLTQSCPKCDGSGWVVTQSGFNPPERDECPNCCRSMYGKLAGEVELDYCKNCKKKYTEHAASDFPDRFCSITQSDSKKWEPKRVSLASQTPLAGNSIHFDSNWLGEHMPKLRALLSRHLIDVSALVQLAKRWAPAVYEARPKRVVDGGTHRALADVRESIAYLRFFRSRGFVGGGNFA